MKGRRVFAVDVAKMEPEHLLGRWFFTGSTYKHIIYIFGIGRQPGSMPFMSFIDLDLGFNLHGSLGVLEKSAKIYRADGFRMRQKALKVVFEKGQIGSHG
jgi:hypothetical protein